MRIGIEFSCGKEGIGADFCEDVVHVTHDEGDSVYLGFWLGYDLNGQALFNSSKT